MFAGLLRQAPFPYTCAGRIDVPYQPSVGMNAAQGVVSVITTVDASGARTLVR